jgi:hypothetical protein
MRQIKLRPREANLINISSTTLILISPTGMGKRRCIGENVAKGSLFLFFSTVLHFFDIVPAEELPDLIGTDGISIAPKPYRVKLIKRFAECD